MRNKPPNHYGKNFFYAKMLVFGLLTGAGGVYAIHENPTSVKQKLTKKPLVRGRVFKVLKKPIQKEVADPKKQRVSIESLCFMGEELPACQEACSNPDKKTYQEMFASCTLNDEPIPTQSSPEAYE